MSEQPTTVKVGDLVVVPEYDGPNNVGTVTQIAEDENGWEYTRVEVDGVVVWEEVAHFRPVNPSEIETDEDV